MLGIDFAGCSLYDNKYERKLLMNLRHKEIPGMNRLNLLDLLLLPKAYYKKIGDRKSTVYLGAVFVGAVDLVFPYLYENYSRLYGNQSGNSLWANVLLSMALITLLGLVDVFFFSLPVYDLFKRFKNPKVPAGASNLVKVMKVYISSHLIIMPISILIYLGVKSLGTEVPVGLAYLSVLLLDFVVPVWFSATITRGMNVLYGLDQRYRLFIFMLVYIWNFLLGFALTYMIQNWIMNLFR